MKIFNIIITTKNKQDDLIFDNMRILDRLHRTAARDAVKPVIHSLQELRNNTWDKDRVDDAIKWLINKFFEVEK